MEVNPVTPTVEKTSKPSSKTLWLLVVAVVLALVLLGVYWFVANNKTSNKVVSPTKTDQIRSDADLKAVEKTLNDADLDSLGKELEQNDTDAATF